MPRRGTAPPSESQRQIQTLRRTTMTQSVAACRRLSFSGPYLSFFLNLANLIPTTSNQIEHMSEAPLLTASLRRPRPGLSLNGAKSSGKHKTLRLTFRPLEIGLIQSGYSICRNSRSGNRLGAWGSCCVRRAPYHPRHRAGISFPIVSEHDAVRFSCFWILHNATFDFRISAVFDTS